MLFNKQTKRKLGMVILVLLVAMPALAVDPVYFADEDLKAAVKEELGITVDPLPDHMKALTSLIVISPFEYLIDDLTGLEYAVNLTYLSLSGNQITDLSPLSGLTKLCYLNLRNNDSITDISPLSGLTNLTFLSLHHSESISDFSPLSDLTNLTNLYLGYTRINDLSPLSSLTNLKDLELHNNALSDVSALSGLTNLEDLTLNNNLISDINSLSGLVNLTTLNLLWNEVGDISALAGMTNMTKLNLEHNQVSDASALAGMANLTDLNIKRNQLRDVNGLSGMTNITDLYLGENQISDISGLSGMTNVEVLYLRGNQINDISAISTLTNLNYLQLSFNQVTDISPVSGLTNLSSIYLSQNQISDISPLSEKTGIRALHLDRNPLNCEAYNIYIPMIKANNPGAQMSYDAAPVCVPDIEVSPLVYDFCDVEVGASESFTVTVSNIGNAELSLECLGMQMYNDDFSITVSTSIPSVISPGESVNINLTFSPSTEGYSSGALIISSDDPDESVVEVAFGGTGIAPSNRAPIADAGDNIQISSADQIYTVLQGTATDPDGDALTCRWQVILDWSAVGAGGEAYLDLGDLAYLTTGNYTLRLEVSDGQLTSSDDMILTIENSPPEAVPGPSSQTVQIGIDPIVVVADVADFDGDPLTYEWLKDGEVLASGSIATVQGGAVVAIPELNLPAGDSRFPLGVHEVELRVSDGVNAPVSALVSVDVTDSTAPSLSPVPSVMILWPPNHELRPVTIQANAYDNGGGAISLAVTVQSSEPPDTDGDGHTISDYYVDSVDSGTGLIELRLRAERSGKGEGRTYTITITATDEGGNQSVATLELLAPHDRRKK